MSTAGTGIDGRIGERIRALRAERGLTLDGLARLAANRQATRIVAKGNKQSPEEVAEATNG